jgi:cytochrome b6-f complex iron-sulfur subunit
MLGAVTSFPVGSWRNVKAARVIVGRDARGIFAYTSVCTHSGCTVPAPASTAAGSTCPCHGSRYNAEGMVTGGPAARSLSNYEVIVCGGDVYLNMARTVAVGTRTAVA